MVCVVQCNIKSFLVLVVRFLLEFTKVGAKHSRVILGLSAHDLGDIPLVLCHLVDTDFLRYSADSQSWQLNIHLRWIRPIDFSVYTLRKLRLRTFSPIIDFLSSKSRHAPFLGAGY